MAPRRVMLSAASLQALRAPLEAATAGLPVQFLTLEALAAQPAPDVHAVFVSRDITGLATKTRLTPVLESCYEVMRRSPALAWVHTHSSGSDRPIVAELRGRGVAVSTSSGANAEVVAQTALGAVLALARRFPALMQAQREHRWAPLVAAAPRDLAGQTAVLLGWGPIHRRLQPWLAALGIHTVVLRQRNEPAGPGIPTLPLARWHEALPRADWLLLACPLTPETRGWVNARTLALLPRGAHLVNVARGEVVVEADLLAALHDGRLAGAFLDVHHQEPLPPDSPWWDLPQVMVTPHSAGHAEGNAARVATRFIDNLQRWLQNQPLAHTVA
jgi:phosphoglycerate dehydrogenase-like enzyme